MGARRGSRSVLVIFMLEAIGIVALQGVAGAAFFQPPAGSVVLRDSIGEDDRVDYYFAEGRTGGAERAISRAAEDAGVPNRGIGQNRELDREGIQVFELSTTLGKRTSFLGREIDGQTVQALDLFRSRRVYIALRPWTRVNGSGLRLVQSDPFVRRFAVDGYPTVMYSVTAWFLVQAGLIVLAFGVVPFAVLRPYARGLEHRRMSKVDKVHRLRAAMLAVGLIGPLGLLAAMFLGGLSLVPEVLLGGAAPALSREPALAMVAFPLLMMLFALALLPGYLAIVPTYRNLRGIEHESGHGRRSLRIGLAFTLPMLSWLVLLSLLRGSGMGEGIRLGVDFAYLMLMLGLSPLLLARLLPTRELDPELRKRLMALAGRCKVRVKDIRVLEARYSKTANALIIGILPRARYIFITDYLLDRFDHDEVEAVVAHELGHGHQHHLLIKLASVIAFLAVWIVAFALAASVLGHGSISFLIGSTPMVMLLGLILVQGALGLVLERKADEYAAERVGASAMIRALERLAEANMAKRRTGPLWNLLTQHPGIQQRVERLRDRWRQHQSNPTA